jgi:uncharacterized protein YbcI
MFSPNKKAGLGKYFDVFHHAGLLVNGPPAWADCPLHLVNRAIPQRQLYRAASTTHTSGGPAKSKWIVPPAWVSYRLRQAGIEITMKTQGEIEAAICEGITRFEQEYMGRGPKDIQTYLINDLLVVRLQGVLTAAEQQLVKSLPAEKGRDLLKQVRTQLIEAARSVVEGMIQEVTGVEVLSLHHDISTVTGEELLLFTLSEPPAFRESRKK